MAPSCLLLNRGLHYSQCKCFHMYICIYISIMYIHIYEAATIKHHLKKSMCKGKKKKKNGV